MTLPFGKNSMKFIIPTVWAAFGVIVLSSCTAFDKLQAGFGSEERVEQISYENAAANFTEALEHYYTLPKTTFLLETFKKEDPKEDLLKTELESSLKAKGAMVCQSIEQCSGDTITVSVDSLQSSEILAQIDTVKLHLAQTFRISGTSLSPISLMSGEVKDGV